MKLAMALSIALLLVASASSWAATTYSWEMVPTFADYSVPISSDDVIEGLNVTNGGAVIEAGGFHPAFPALNDAARLTDGQLGGGTDSVLQDFGMPSLKIAYYFDPQQIWQIRSFAGNPDLDARVFQNVDVEVQIMGNWFEILHEATTGAFNRSNDGYEGSLIKVYDDAGGPLMEGDPISGVRLTYWCVNNTQNWFVTRDIAQGASIIKEIDVVVPEPASMLVLLTGAAGLLIRRRSSK